MGCSALRPQLGSDPCFSELQEQTGICGMIRFVNIRRKEVMWLDMDGGGDWVKVNQELKSIFGDCPAVIMCHWINDRFWSVF